MSRALYPLAYRHRPSQGVALVVALVLLLVITTMGVASIRSVVLEEKMASNHFDRALAFQAAEAGLRAGEALAHAQSQAVPPHPLAAALNTPTSANECSSSCNQGVCAPPGAFCNERWNIINFTGWVNANDIELTDLAGAAPQYFIEYLGSNFPCDPGQPDSNLTCTRYRVTARSNAGNDRAVVMLQSIYATQ